MLGAEDYKLQLQVIEELPVVIIAIELMKFGPFPYRSLKAGQQICEQPR
jgi:hypothetical protein